MPVEGQGRTIDRRRRKTVRRHARWRASWLWASGQTRVSCRSADGISRDRWTSRQQRSAARRHDLLAAGDARGLRLVVRRLGCPACSKRFAAQSPVRAAGDRRSRRRSGRSTAPTAWMQSGLYGKVTVHHQRCRLVPAAQVCRQHGLRRARTWHASCGRSADAKLYESVRPYGGVMHLLAGDNREPSLPKRLIEAMNLEQAEVEVGRHSVIVRREGALARIGRLDAPIRRRRQHDQVERSAASSCRWACCGSAAAATWTCCRDTATVRRSRSSADDCSSRG